MTNKPDNDSPQPRDPDDVYKHTPLDRAMHRANRNMTDLVVGVSNALAEGARAFGTTVRERTKDDAARPGDLVEATALSMSRALAALATTWQDFYDRLVRDRDERRAPTAAPEPIDYDRLATLVAEKLRNPPGK